MNSILETMQEIKKIMDRRNISVSEMIKFLNNPVDSYGLTLKEKPLFDYSDSTFNANCNCKVGYCNGRCT